MNWSERTAGTGANVSGAGSGPWSDPAAAVGVSNGNFFAGTKDVAHCTLGSNEGSEYLQLTNFGFDSDLADMGVPDGATIRGVCARIHVGEIPIGTPVGLATVAELLLVKAGSPGGTSVGGSRPIKLAAAGGGGQVNWFSNFPDRALNGVENLWGNTILSSDVRKATFGFALRVAKGAGGSGTIGVDSAPLKVYWAASIAAVIKDNSAASALLEAPCVIQATAVGSPNGAGAWQPEECEFRWGLSHPLGYTPTVYADPRPGAGVLNQNRSMATAFVGPTYGVLATVAGTYTATCTHVAPDGSSATGSAVFTVGANTRPIKYVDSVNGSNNNSGNSPTDAWETINNAFVWALSNGRRMWLRILDDQTITFAAEALYNGNGTDDIVISREGSGTNPPILKNNIQAQDIACIRHHNCARALIWAYNGTALAHYNFMGWMATAWEDDDVAETTSQVQLSASNNFAPQSTWDAYTAARPRSDRFGLHRDYRGVARNMADTTWAAGATSV